MIGIFLPPMALDVSKINYAYNLLKIFDKPENKSNVIVLVYKQSSDLLNSRIKHLEINSYGCGKMSTLRSKLSKVFNRERIPEFQMAILKHKITFAIFPTPTMELKHCTVPFAASFQSLGHRLNPELQETAGGRLWENREDLYTFVCNKASMIFIDSEIGKKYLKFYYEPKGTIVVIPHDVPVSLNVEVSDRVQKDILKKFGVVKKFLFYPAQLWPHKNHIRILEANKILLKRGVDVQLVFTASSKSVNNEYGIESRLKRIARESGLDQNLIITGFLDDKEIITFYKNALAMIMPQLIPEPCLPYVESLGLKCPVIASDIPGIKDQLDGAAILVNPYSIESIANGIFEIYDNEQMQMHYKKLGIKRYNMIKRELNLCYDSLDAEFKKVLYATNLHFGD